jgi:hypothetical protein
VTRIQKKEIQLAAVVNDRNQLRLDVWVTAQGAADTSLSEWQWHHALQVFPLQQFFLATAADAKMFASAEEDGTYSSNTDTAVLGTWCNVLLLLVVIRLCHLSTSLHKQLTQVHHHVFFL